MKRLVSLNLAFVFFLTAIASLGNVSTAYAKTKNMSTCENGECIDGLLDRLNDLGQVYQRECLPSEGLKRDLASYHEENGLSEKCWKLITEINHLEEELSKHQTKLEERLGCQSGNCSLPNQEDSLNSQLSELTKVEQKLSCTEPKKKAIRAQCPSDMNCVLVSTALGMGGFVIEKLMPKASKPKGCHLGNDSCMTQLATGFIKATISFFEGAWDLLKMAGKAVKKKAGQFWNWVTGAENHSSNTQLAMAKASKDDGVFKMLLKDFPGTMKKIWGAFVGAMKEWLKTDIFCQKWSGVAHLSKCLEPTDSFDCISCKSMVNGLCAISGTLVAEVVPAFLTGGLVTAAKYGANGAVKIAKLFKVTSKGARAIKNSRVGKLAISTSNKVDDALRISKGVRAAKVAVEGALKAIRRYMLSPTRKLMKNSITALTKLSKKGGLMLAKTPGGKYIVFAGKSAALSVKFTGKIILYPIDNPMTTFAFKAGQRSFDTAFKLGAAKISTTSAAVTGIIKSDVKIESALTKVEEIKLAPDASQLVKAEAQLLKEVEPKRVELTQKILSDYDSNVQEIIRDLYPELKYGDLAKTLPKEKIIAAEKELYEQIARMPDGPYKEDLLRQYNAHVIQGEARIRVVGDDSPTYAQIIENSKLSDEKRFKQAIITIKRSPANAAEEAKLQKALKEAHLSGPDNGVFEYSWRELREKYRILTEGGFSKDEADLLIRSGLAGRPPVRELIKPGDTLFSGFADDIVEGHYLEKKEELVALIRGLEPEKKKNFFQKILGQTGNNPKEAERILDNFDSLYFVDYQHAIPELEHVLQGQKAVKGLTISEKYERKAFDNFQEARKYLLEEKPEMTKETLLEIHKKMMKGGVEDVAPKDMGVIRDGAWYGNVPSSQPIDNVVLKNIDENPYLTWVETQDLGNGKFAGQIQYPNAVYVKPQGLELIRKNHPDLVKEIEEFQKLSDPVKAKLSEYSKLRASGADYDKQKKAYDEYLELNKALTEKYPDQLKLNKRLVEAMVDDLMDWFTRERTLIGEINSPEKLDEYVNLVSKFQRDLVSIHPLANGNGRSTREFALSYAMMKEGFPPPRIIDPNADIYRSLEDWRKIIKHGILASDFLVDDMVERLKFGLPIENSVELITPYTRPPVQMALKGQKKVPYMDGVEYIDPRLYREILKREIAANPALKTEMAQNPVEAWDKIHKKVEEVFSKNNLYYNHTKHGIERVSLNFVDDDFKLLYGKASFNNKELFDFKMKTWYSNDVTWRGLASKHAEKSEAEIIQMFSEMTSHNASNAVLGKIRSGANPETIRKAALEDFEKYNNDVFGDGLVQMARDHSETGPMYGISYGYSTSKNREVGKAFAMGAMVVGEYGSHRAPELQALLKSRVLVGARRANKDVDLGRLKQLREEFSYKYGRQQEVMGIGASDPDAITIVQTIDAEGGVMLSYLRNKENPAEIFVVKGDIDPDAVPKAEQIVKTIKLAQK